MKKTLLVIVLVALFCYCSPSKSARNTAASTPQTNSTPRRLNLPDNFTSSDTLSSDTIVITGTEYIPLEGRSETGTRVDLEGAWELDSLNGALVPGKSAINVDITTPNIPEGGEWRHDSTTTTKVVNGVTHTTTTVLVDRMVTLGNKITPPQGPNYHIPAKPAISFYGANETFSGFTGCNRFSGRYSVAGKDTINLQSAAASTKMVCIGDYDENAFLSTLKRVNSFKAVNGHLQLLSGNQVVLVFSKKQLQQNLTPTHDQ